MLVGVVDDVNCFVENKAQLCWVSTESTSHICQSFQENTQSTFTPEILLKEIKIREILMNGKTRLTVISQSPLELTVVLFACFR